MKPRSLKGTGYEFVSESGNTFYSSQNTPMSRKVRTYLGDQKTTKSKKKITPVNNSAGFLRDTLSAKKKVSK